MKQPNYGYYTERIAINLRSDWVEKIDSLVNQPNHYTNRQAVIREALKQFLD